MDFLKEYKILKKLKKHREESCLIVLKNDESKLQESIKQKSILEKRVEIFHQDRIQKEIQVFNEIVSFSSMLSLKELNKLKQGFQQMKEQEMHMCLKVASLGEVVQKCTIAYDQSYRKYFAALHSSLKAQKMMDNLLRQQKLEQEYKESLEIEELVQTKYTIKGRQDGQ